MTPSVVAQGEDCALNTMVARHDEKVKSPGICCVRHTMVTAGGSHTFNKRVNMVKE
jgi:hypothetical protein